MPASRPPQNAPARRQPNIAITVGIIAAAIALAVAAYLLIPLRAPSTPARSVDYWPTDEWRTAPPEEQGFDSAALADGLQKLEDDGIPIDSLLIIRNGEIILDAYFEPYDGSFPHDMASVTKSITTTLVGIAAGQGLIDLDSPMLTYFAGRTIANLDARKQAVTVRHLAGMTNGFKSGCLNGDEPTLEEMRQSPDWIQHTLDRPMLRDPGKTFCYDSPGMHLLSAILQQTTGMTEEQFARQYLFGPLGIHEYVWESDPQGYTDGWGDLDLLPRDAAKLGYLWLGGGVWDGQQIVPASWVKEAVLPRLRADGSDYYGYGWWVSRDSYWALGRGGQHVKIYPDLDAIVVVTAAGLDYDQLDTLLEASFKDRENALPPNPAGVEALAAAVKELATPEESFPTTSLSPTAARISGKTYVFGADAAGVLDLTSLTLTFVDPSEVIMHVVGVNDENVWHVGLNGKYLLDDEGRALRGYWKADDTFVFEMFDIGQLTFYLRFEGDRAFLTSDNYAGEFVGITAAP